MKILVINAGSSSIRSKLFQSGKDHRPLARVHIDGIGLKRCRFTLKSDEKNLGLHLPVKNHSEGIKLLLQHLTKIKIIEKYTEIKAVGHRVVHGEEKYTAPVKIDAKVIKELEKISPLAPLHNPANIEAIKACKKLLPKAKQAAIFDTAFFQTMPQKAYLYGLPHEYYEKHKIRRYGFHGISHQYIVNETIKLLKRKSAKIISCHIGNGVSITASINGKAVDTSMGFTPLEGLIMGTRSGSIDPAIVIHLQKELKMKPDQITHLLNFESGLKALSQISSDMRDVYAASLKKDESSMFAIEILSYQIAKYIGSYAAGMNGADAIVFTAGIGENAFYVREKTCEYLGFLGVKLNAAKNEKSELIISDGKSKVKVLVIPTDEEKQIATQTMSVLKLK
ncbi:MAG: acetate kinase [Candidatus Peregrinibacteria bacterium]